MNESIVNAIRLLILCAFAFVPLLLGEYARNKAVPTTGDFILHGRSMKPFPMYATVFATWMSAFAFMGGIAYFYEQGPIYMTSIGWDALFGVLFILIGRRIWYYGRKRNYTTPTDFFSDIYDSRVLNLMVTAITVVCTMVYLQAQIVGGLLILEIATDGVISWYVGGVIFFAILVIYLWAGGLRAVALTDIFYGSLIVFAILSSGFFLMKTAGGTEQVFEALVRMDAANVSMTGERGAERTLMWICLFIVVPVGAFMGPQIWIRNYAAGSAGHFTLLPLLLTLSSIVCVGTLFAGSASLFLVEESDNPDAILLELMAEHAGPYFTILIIVGIYASIFSTANSQVHALSAVYTMDIHKRYFNRRMADRGLVSVAKWTVLVVAAVSYVLIIIMPQNIFDLAVMAMGGTAQLLIPVLGAFFWNRSTARAAITGLTAGLAVFLLGTFLDVADGSICAVSGMILNGFLFLIVGLADRPRFRVYKKIELYRKEYNRRFS